MEFGQAQGHLAWNLREQKKFPEAEPPARECYEINSAQKADPTQTFDTRTLLIDALLGQKKYADAKPLALLAHEDLTKRGVFKDKPALQRERRRDAITRLVSLYTAWGKADEAKEWEGKLSQAKGQ